MNTDNRLIYNYFCILLTFGNNNNVENIEYNHYRICVKDFVYSIEYILSK